MERLKIDEVIAHCNKQVERMENYLGKKQLEETNVRNSSIMKQYWEHRQVAEYLNELQQYRAIGTPDQCREAVERMKGEEHE